VGFALALDPILRNVPIGWPKTDDFIGSFCGGPKYRRGEINGLSDPELVGALYHDGYSFSDVTPSAVSKSGSHRLWPGEVRALVLLAQAPKLKTLVFDGRFDHIAGKIVGRIPVRSDGAYGTPRAELLRQLAAVQISAERTQLGICLGLEDEKSHHTASILKDGTTPAFAAVVRIGRYRR
jgi:hypothetical protein